MKIVIIGGVAGGASAAARARRLDEHADIVLIERGPDVSFANCGLPYFLGGVIAPRDKLLVTTASRLRERFRLDVRTGCEAISIERAAKTIRLRSLADGTEVDESYDKLILAPGAAPIVPPFAQPLPPHVFTLRNLEDMDRIHRGMPGDAGTAVIVGAGFIGLELAENFVRRKLKVHLVELADQVLAPLDREMTVPIEETLEHHGIVLHLARTAEALEPAGDKTVVVLSDGTRLEAGLVVLGVGVRPENRLAVQAGLEVGPRGGIRVDDGMRTLDPDIFAVGDCIETKDFLTGGPTQVPLAGPANRQGRIAAENALGGSLRFRGTQATAICGIFDKTAACTGLAEKTLRKLGRPYLKAYLHPAHHAGYYPGADSMTLKLLFDPETGKVLGAQGVGGAGVDKRIDVLAVAIQAGLTVHDLEEVELAYAPQFGSAKDPVNMAGFIAAGVLRGTHPQCQVDELPALTAAGTYLLDVRTAGEFSAGHIPGAVNIPVDELRNRLGELPAGVPIAAYCQVGMRGYLATRILLQRGFAARNLSGGWKTYCLFHPA